MKIVTNIEYKDNKIKEADDINSLTGGADSKGTLLLNKKTNIYIPNTIQDRQQIIDYINSAIDEINSTITISNTINTSIQSTMTAINALLQLITPLAVALDLSGGSATTATVLTTNITNAFSLLATDIAELPLKTADFNVIKQNLDDLYSKLA